jgi:hypothetical protein
MQEAEWFGSSTILKSIKNIRLIGSSLERYVHVSEEEGASSITLFGSYPMI